MNLKNTSTLPDKGIEEDITRKETASLINEIGELQLKLYAQSKAALLVIFQGMDTSGKDGAIRKVFADVNPMGCHVISFKKPTELEYSHDFLWRIHQQMPPFGMIHAFNRSHYEDILVPAVEGYISEKIIKERYNQINDFEKMLVANNTHVVKIFLHISKEEQEERLKERMSNPKKFWKHKDSDWETRKKWDQYLDVYESILEKCNDIPWTVVPSDKNWYKEYMVAAKILDALKKIDPNYPELVTKMNKS
jgi:PPK2 family polyphosphate:nucleotide phosphotransferase